jgi:hypothetical protein
MSTTTSPHEFRPLRFYDRFHKNGRCWCCIMPRAAHPVPIWAAVRFEGDGRYYTPLEHLATGLRNIKASRSNP